MEEFLAAVSFIALYGISYGVVLFTISVGLVVTMGLMRVVNLAHCAFAATGGYLAVALMKDLGVPFLAAVFIAVLAVAALSVVVERLCYVHLYEAGELDQVLMTTGLIFVAIAALNLAFGPNAYTVQLPAWLSGNVNLAGRSFEIYRLFLIAVGVVLVLTLWLLFEHTNFGARLRAAVDNRTMAQATGIDVPQLFSVAFALGNGLAAFGGAIGYSILPMEPMYPFKYLTLVLIIVTLAGYGNIKDSAAVALFVGIVDTAGRYLFPTVGAFIIYVLVVAVLMWQDRRLVLGWITR
jgi:branched-chain amino acid transport system permease protein